LPCRAIDDYNPRFMRPDPRAAGDVPMELSRRDLGKVTILDISGKLTTTDGGGQLKERVSSLIAEGHKNIILNLANLSYMDSAGLGEMVACHSTAAKNGGVVKLANTTSRMKDLLTITKLVTVFDAHDTEAQAVSSFNQ
jgi:anti-sigma B factor antagonist